MCAVYSGRQTPAWVMVTNAAHGATGSGAAVEKSFQKLKAAFEVRPMALALDTFDADVPREGRGSERTVIKREVVPKTSTWGQQRLLREEAAFDKSKWFKGEGMAELRRLTGDPNKVALEPIPAQGSPRKAPVMDVTDKFVKQGPLELCEGERGTIAMNTALFRSAKTKWRRAWLSLSSSSMRLYDVASQDRDDPLEAIDVHSILRCQAQDTCTFCIESMVDGFMGSWSFYFRTESRLERDSWVAAIDQQVRNAHTARVKSPLSPGFGAPVQRRLGGPSQESPRNPNKQQCGKPQWTPRNDLKASCAVLSPRSGGKLSPKKCRGGEQTGAENQKSGDEETGFAVRRYKDELQRPGKGAESRCRTFSVKEEVLDEDKCVLWCREIPSIEMANKIITAFTRKKATTSGPDAKAGMPLRPVEQHSRTVLTSASGRIGCMLVFDTGEDARKAKTAVDFFAGHEGQGLMTQMICQSDVVRTAGIFTTDGDLHVKAPSTPSTGSAGVSCGSGRAGMSRGIVAAGSSEGQGHRPPQAPQHPARGLQPGVSPGQWDLEKRLNCGHLPPTPSGARGFHPNTPAESNKMLGGRRPAVGKVAAKGKKPPEKRPFLKKGQKAKTVELRALLPNPGVLSYFLVKYDPHRSRIQMDFVSNNSQQTLWTGAIADVSVEPTLKSSTAGNVNVTGGGDLGVQFAGRQWSEFSKLAKTATIAQRALEKYMIEQGELERCERKYINMEEPVKIIDGAKALNLQTQNRLSAPESHDAARMDIGGKDLQEVIAELSTLRESVSSIDQNVLGMVSDYANKMSSSANLSSHDNSFLSLLDRAKINSPDAKDSLMALSAVSQPNSVGGQAIVEAIYDWDNQRQVKVVKKSGRTEINPHSHRMDASIAAAVLNGQREWTDLRDATAESGSLQREYSYGFQVVKEVSREASKDTLSPPSHSPSGSKEAKMASNLAAEKESKLAFELASSLAKHKEPADTSEMMFGGEIRHNWTPQGETKACPSDFTMKPAQGSKTISPSNKSKHKIIPQIRLPAAVHGGYYDAWEQQAQHHDTLQLDLNTSNVAQRHVTQAEREWIGPRRPMWVGANSTDRSDLSKRRQPLGKDVQLAREFKGNLSPMLGGRLELPKSKDVFPGSQTARTRYAGVARFAGIESAQLQVTVPVEQPFLPSMHAYFPGEHWIIPGQKLQDRKKHVLAPGAGQAGAVDATFVPSPRTAARAAADFDLLVKKNEKASHPLFLAAEQMEDRIRFGVVPSLSASSISSFRSNDSRGAATHR